LQRLHLIQSPNGWAEYLPLTFQFQDDGNFKEGVWSARLVALVHGKSLLADDGQLMANILFYRKEDTVFMANLVTLLRTLSPSL